MTERLLELIKSETNRSLQDLTLEEYQDLISKINIQFKIKKRNYKKDPTNILAAALIASLIRYKVENNISNVQLGKILNIHRNRVGHIISGQTNVTLLAYLQIQDKLNINILQYGN